MSLRDPCQHKHTQECHCCHVTRCLDCRRAWVPPEAIADVWPEVSASRLRSLQSSIEANTDVWQRLADCETNNGEE